jgi:hypothetical protein
LSSAADHDHAGRLTRRPITVPRHFMTTGFSMGQLRTANKRRNRALAATVAARTSAPAPAPVKAAAPKRAAKAKA